MRLELVNVIAAHSVTKKEVNQWPEDVMLVVINSASDGQECIIYKHPHMVVRRMHTFS